MHGAVSLRFGDDKLFIGPKHNIYTFSLFYLVFLIWHYQLSVKFVMWIVKQKIENKQNHSLHIGTDDSTFGSAVRTSDTVINVLCLLQQ